MYASYGSIYSSLSPSQLYPKQLGRLLLLSSQTLSFLSLSYSSFFLCEKVLILSKICTILATLPSLQKMSIITAAKNAPITISSNQIQVSLWQTVIMDTETCEQAYQKASSVLGPQGDSSMMLQLPVWAKSHSIFLLMRDHQVRLADFPRRSRNLSPERCQKERTDSSCEQEQPLSACLMVLGSLFMGKRSNLEFEWMIKEWLYN